MCVHTTCSEPQQKNEFIRQFKKIKGKDGNLEQKFTFTIIYHKE